MADRRDPTLVGQMVLGRYRVLRRIAQGGMGAVYLARTEGARGFTKPVVVKRILSTLRDDDASSMFAREARILSLLQHPGIVSVLDFGQEPGGDLVMVLDYVHGYHLGHFQRYLHKVRGGMPYEMALHVMIGVLDALHYAHTFRRPDGAPMEIVHRDISPGNILLDVTGHLKLVDFGIARAEGDADEYHTQTSRLKGKFAYLPVEIFKGAEPTVQADVYACGVVLYELLTGENPFRGKEATDSYDKVLNVVPVPASTLRSDIPAAIDAVIGQAIARDCAQRFGSAQALATALRALRGISDEQGRALLSAEVDYAFSGPLAKELGIEPLSVRDTAWRAGTETDDSLRSISTVPPPALDESAGQTESDAEMPTRSASPLALAGARAWRSNPPQAPDLSNPPPELAPDEQDDEVPRPSELATVALSADELAELSGTTQSIAAPEPVPAQRSASRAPIWIALVIGTVLVGAAVSVFRARDAPPERIVVIERQPSEPAVPAAAPPLPTTAAQPAPPVAAVAPVDSKTALVDDKAPAASDTARVRSTEREHRASAADPKLLTRTFARQQARIEACFRSGSASSEPSGIAIDFQVAASGEVEHAELTPASVASTPLGQCLVAVAKSTRFPRLQDSVSFRIPLAARRVPAR